MAERLKELDRIQGVFTMVHRAMVDERGRFTEIFRQEWFPQRSWEQVQCNRSESRRGVLRGLHFHRQQVDYWQCVDGCIRVGLYDLRPGSSTGGAGTILDMDSARPCGIFIPAGVAHGYLALTDATIIYVVDRYYDGGNDEFGVAWDDPDIGLAWGVEEGSEVILSERDTANPSLRDLDDADLPA